MPGSVMSATTISGSSTSSRRGKTRHYRTISHTSNADESLFASSGQANKNRNANNDNIENVALEDLAYQRQKHRRKGQKPPKEVVQIITKDLIRSLIVPTEDPSGKSIILTNAEYDRIKSAAIFYTRDQKKQMEDQMAEEKLKKQEECSDRKTQMKKLDMERLQNEPLNEIEQDAKERGESLLANATAKKHEQEDEIKRLNELILNARCHAIRDAQVLEKAHIKSELGEEDKRLDMMMEVERRNGIVIQEEIESRKKEERLLGAAMVQDQIANNEQDRLFDLERKDQENIQIQKNTLKMMEEDRQQLIKKKDEQDAMRDTLNEANDQQKMQRHIREEQKTQDTLNEANDQQKMQRHMREEQEKLEDKKVARYMKDKAEREAAYEAEQDRIRIEKEKETARLRAMQERASDEQAARDELRAKRAQEKTEREWRKKEAEEMQRKHETNEMLRVAREEQTRQKENVMAIQAQQERVEFDRVLQAQKESIEKDRRMELEHTSKGQVYSKQLRAQVREKEQERIMARNKFFQEGVELDAEARDRRLRLDEVKRQKLNALRDAGIPEKYVSQVQRKVNLETAPVM